MLSQRQPFYIPRQIYQIDSTWSINPLDRFRNFLLNE